MPSTMKPKWLIDVYAMKRMMSRLPIARIAPYKIEMVARTSTTGVAHWLGSRDRPGQNPTPREGAWTDPDNADGADLLHHADHQGGAASGGLLGRVREPGVQRHQRRLDRKREHEANEQPPASSTTKVQFAQRAQQ